MNPVDRATLIDFALGRLEDAEAAALARRAEVDSEFAQTLDALRQELTTLDRVRLDALRAAPRRAPLVIADDQNTQDAGFRRSLNRSDDANYNEDAENATSVSSSNDDAFDVRDASDGENSDDALFLASASNVVKIRRVGPAYPFYADEPEKSTDETEPFPTFAAENRQNDEAEQEAQNNENGEAEQEAQNNENGKAEQEAQNNENGEAEQEAQNNENGEAEQEAQNNEYSETRQGSQASRRSKRFDFIPKFIAASSPSQGSPFVAKRARLLDAPVAEISNVAEFFETPSNINADDRETVADFNFSNVEPTDEAQDENIRDARPSESANDEENGTQAAQLEQEERLCRVDNQETVANFNFSNVEPTDEAQDENIRDARPNESANDEENGTQAAQLEQEERLCRVDNQETVADFNFSNVEPTDETQDENIRDVRPNESANDEEISPQTSESVDEERFYRVDYQNSVEDFNAANLATRRLVELLGREPTAAEREEYYWEEVDEDENVEISAEFRRPSLLKTSARWATAPVVAVGRATLALCAPGRRAILGADAYAATQPRRRRQPGKASDTMISTVAGILIATFVVFPLMRLAVREMFATIAKSAVRKIGENVAISENAPQSDLLPFISEQLVFPRYETADPQGVGAETLLETGTRSETPLPPVDASPLPVDPASTPPTLEPVPVGALLDDALSPTTF